MRWTRITGTLVVAAAMFGGLAGSAWAAATLWTDFEKEKGSGGRVPSMSTPSGRGWRAAKGGTVGPADAEYVKHSAVGVFDFRKGTVEIEVVRDNIREELEALFTLQDADGVTILAEQVYWDREGESSPILQIKTDEGDLWYRGIDLNGFGSQESSWFPLPKISKGSKVNITFTWGPAAADNTIFVNGRKIAALVNDQVVMSDVIRRAKSIAIGAQPRKGGAATSQSRSVITKFYVYDQVLDGAQLSANPGQFRPSSEGAPAVASVSHDVSGVAGFSGKIVAGDAVTVTLAGDVGAAGSFDVVHFPDIGGSLTIDWRGWGVHLEQKRFFEEGEVDLRDVEGYDVYAANAPFDPAAPAMEPLAVLKAQEQSYTMAALSVDTPYYVAVVARMRDGTLRNVIAPIANVPLVETAPGVYTGSFKSGWHDRYPRAAVIGRLASGALSTTLTAAYPFEIDPTLTLTMGSDPAEIKADEKSTSTISVMVANANGRPVSGHKVRFLLATTSQYTGVVGGGAFTEQVGGAIAEEQWGQTDLFGKVSATYVAGFAAKTAIVVARDMLSNSTGAAYVKTFIQATASLELEPVMTASRDIGYTITVTSSDEWLTADGKSQARITAKVTLNNQPVEGHAVNFTVSPGSGTIRAVLDTTNRKGEARAVYTAGKKIGIALITATDTTAGISGTVAIELRSDAPAKIAITIDPGKLPADGSSRAELKVVVTDINDNPNDNTPVEYRIASGDGRLRDDSDVTDRSGESTMEYRAGSSPGQVSFEITVRSTVPTDGELAIARDLALAVTDYKFF